MSGTLARFGALVVLAALLAGAGVGETRAAETLPPGIDWFDGSVEQAFERAQAENTPLFLYWGAVWCPPCVEIRQTVFKSPQFLAQAKLFLPVYLDGDTERAQTWGERFDARFYPTMIVFNPAGEEVTRLHAGIDLAAYTDVLGLSLERMRPTAELMRQAQRDPAALGPDDFQQLAYYSWYEGGDLDGAATPALFLALSDAAAPGNPGASARLYLQHLVALAGADPPGAADPARLRAILGDADLVLAGWDYLITPESIVPALGGSQEERAELERLWAGRLRELRHDESLSTKNRLYGWRPLLVFHDADGDAPLPDDVVQGIRAEGRAAAASVAGTHARQSVINTIANVYVLAGLSDDARELLTAEIGKSKTPYYFMGSLASLEERQGNDAVALEWRRKAYEAAEGPATRIRWWASYVQALTRLAPQEAAAIAQAAMFVFDPAQGMEDIFSGANFRNLERAAGSLGDWRGERPDDTSVLAEFEAALRQACSAQAAGSTERSNCGTLL
jgi:hypothetical protein